ncbi:hypothetical protein LZ31DRAFT_358138 [Colletotrichum somersetense]|nr:hypothetical protein LZ31DRAFT_358138 [Colletotrichum somersetense]
MGLFYKPRRKLPCIQRRPSVQPRPKRCQSCPRHKHWRAPPREQSSASAGRVPVVEAAMMGSCGQEVSVSISRTSRHAKTQGPCPSRKRRSVSQSKPVTLPMRRRLANGTGI